MARAHLDSLAVDLVRPSTVIPEGGGALSHVESLSSAERLSVVEGLDGRENVSVSLDQFGDLDKDLSSLESGSVQSPSSVESLAGGFDGDFDVGLDTLGNGGEDFAGGGVDDTGVSATSASPGDHSAGASRDQTRGHRLITSRPIELTRWSWRSCPPTWSTRRQCTAQWGPRPCPCSRRG